MFPFTFSLHVVRGLGSGRWQLRAGGPVRRRGNGANTPPTSRDNRNRGGHALLPPSKVGRRTARGGCESSRGAAAPLLPPASAGPVPPPAPQPDPVPAAARRGPSAALLGEPRAPPHPSPDRDPTVPFLAGSSRQGTTASRAPLRPARCDSGFCPAPLAFPPAKFVPASRRTGVEAPGSRSGSRGEEKEGGGNKTAAVARTSAAPPRDVPGRARPGPERVCPRLAPHPAPSAPALRDSHFGG